VSLPQIIHSPSQIIHIQRRPAPGQVSIERVFAQVRRALPANIDCTMHTSPCLSRGFLPRVVNACHAAKYRAQLFHITGDAHYLALALDGARTLLTIHDCVSLERLRGLKRALFRLLWYDAPVRRAALVSVVSESTRRALLRHTNCDPSKVRVIHNCVSNDFVACPKPFNPVDPLLLQVGTGKTKNLERVIPALAGLRCRMKIIGRLHHEHLHLLHECRVPFTNVPYASDTELLRAYEESDLVLFASAYEGFGLPIVEANATGRPVLTSNLQSMPEVAGSAACLVDPFDVAAIRAGLLKLLRDAAYRDRLVEAGFENAKRFTPNLIANQYAALYQEMLAPSQTLERRPGISDLHFGQ
jgi:glycosyltransferase involved in cell wall biosynthesis